MKQECAFYGYTFKGHVPMEEKWLGEDEVDGEIVVKAGKYCKKVSFNRYVYNHDVKDVETHFIKEVLEPIFDEIAQKRMTSKRNSRNVSRDGAMQQLRQKRNEGFVELHSRGSETYFWPLYDLVETVACTLPVVESIETHKGIFLDFTIKLNSGLKYRFTPHDFASMEACVYFLEALIRMQETGIVMTAEDDVVATTFASELIEKTGLFPIDEETILIHVDRADYNPYDSDHFRRQLVATVIKKDPIPIPAGYVAC